MATNYFERFIRDLDQWGITDVLLPFLLIFVLVYAVLQKSNVLGQGKKNLNIAVAVIMGLLVVIPHVLHAYPKNADPVEILNSALPAVSIIIVASIMLLILLGIFGAEAVVMGAKLKNWITGISALIILIIFGYAAGWWGNWKWLSNLIGDDAISLIIILLVFGLIIAFVTGEDKKGAAAGHGGGDHGGGAGGGH